MKNLLSRYISLSLALRYLNPLRTFFSIITLICLLGVSLGVMVLIVVLSVRGICLRTPRTSRYATGTTSA